MVFWHSQFNNSINKAYGIASDSGQFSCCFPSHTVVHYHVRALLVNRLSHCRLSSWVRLISFQGTMQFPMLRLSCIARQTSRRKLCQATVSGCTRWGAAAVITTAYTFFLYFNNTSTPSPILWLCRISTYGIVNRYPYSKCDVMPTPCSSWAVFTLTASIEKAWQSLRKCLLDLSVDEVIHYSFLDQE